MALPVASAPLPPDIAIHGWGAITVRIAWTLMQMGVRVTKDVLMDARDHVLFHLEPQTDIATAEDMAEYLTREFIYRARHRRDVEKWPQDARMPISPRWHRALTYGLSPLDTNLFKQHYGNGIPLATLEQTLGLDGIVLEGARGAIREVLRSMATEDGMPIQTWPNERIDRLISRIAAFTDHPSPPLDEVADGCHQEMIRACPRCERTWRLAQNGVLTSEDLVAPGVIARPEQQVRLLALHFHPDGRQHRALLSKEIKTPWFPLGEDILLIDLSQEEAIINIILLATELGTPAREHLRGTILTGTGRWSPHGLLGPLPSDAYQTMSSLTWGTVSPIGELPAPLPTPPSSNRWWSLSVSISIFAVLMCWVAFGVSSKDMGVFPLSTEFHHDANSLWVQFDVEEEAIITMVSQNAQRLEVMNHTFDITDKAQFAVGDGSFRARAPGQALLLVSTHAEIPDLRSHILTAQTAAEPLKALASRIKSAAPKADIRIYQPEGIP